MSDTAAKREPSRRRAGRRPGRSSAGRSILAASATVVGCCIAAIAAPELAALAPSDPAAPLAESGRLALIASGIAAVTVWPVAWLLLRHGADNAAPPPRPAHIQEPRATPEVGKPGPKPTMDRAEINRIRLAAKESEARTRKLVDDFLETAPGMADHLRGAMDRGDMPAAGRHAGRLRSASAGVGSRELPGILADVEVLARAGDLGGVRAAAKDVDRAFDDLTAALKALGPHA